MSASEVQVQPDSTGKKIQTFANTIGSDLVQAQGVVVVDASGVPVPSVTGSATPTQVPASVTSVTILASNAARASASVFNDSVSATLYLIYGATATTAAYKVQLGPGAYFELPQPIYTGVVAGIWTGAVGNAVVSEET